MKLVSINVKNFRAIGENPCRLTLEDSDIIFLFGRNNVGKSTLLHAYSFFVASSQKPQVKDFHNYDPDNNIEIEGIFKVAEGEFIDIRKPQLEKWKSADNLVKIRKVWQKIGEAPLKQTFDPETNEYVDNGFGGMEPIFTSVAPTPITIPAMPSTENLTKWVNDLVSKKVLKSLKSDEQVLFEKVIAGLKEIGEKVSNSQAVKEINEAANQQFRKVFPSLALEVNTAAGQEFDIAKAIEKEFSIVIKDDKNGLSGGDFTSHSDGVIRQAMFNILGVVGSKNPANEKSGDLIEEKSMVILFEEPEIYLHPSAARAVRDALYDLSKPESSFQVICATHDPLMIDLTRNHVSLVRCWKDSKDSTFAFQVGFNVFNQEDEFKDKFLMIQRFNPFVCESFFADRVLIVEGDTEAIFFRDFLARFAPKEELFVLNAGSKTNIPFFQRIFNHFHIEQIIIHDSDTKTIDGKIKVDGSERKNPAWQLNKTIWALIQEANKKKPGLSRRYVNIPGFEIENGYQFVAEKGKPLSAWEFAKSLDKESDSRAVQFFRHIVGMAIDQEIPEFSMTYLEGAEV
jgi:putative ATP-dependent endonuclease of the OLD family